MACHPPRTDGGQWGCDNTGNLPRCQLCPTSPTYWKLTAAPPAADPWKGGGVTTMVATMVADIEHLIDGKGWTTGPDEPCIICWKPAMLRSPKGAPCHKVCAEQWNREHHRPTAVTT